MKGQKRKGMLAFLLAGVISAPIAAPAVQPVIAFAEENTAQSGTYENLSWHFENGVLTISGEGDMYEPETEQEGIIEEMPVYPWDELAYTDVIIEEGVTSIADTAFMAAELTMTSTSSVLKNVSFPSTLKVIGEFAFCGSLLESVVIPESVETLESGAFAISTMLRDVTIEADLTYIPNDCFSETAIETITLPESVEVIQSAAFIQCKNLKSITLHEGITSIEENAFAYSGLEELHVPDSVTEPSSFASYCPDLHTLTIPESWTYLPDDFATGCTSLQDISGLLHEGITWIGEYAFSQTGVVSVVIPEHVTSIGKAAFLRCENLESVQLRSLLTEISANLFQSCSKLRECNIPDTVVKISAEAFWGTSLTECILPDGLEGIYYRAFATVSVLRDVVLPDSVTEISSEAFSNVRSLTLGAGVKTICDGNFQSVLRMDDIYVAEENPKYAAEDGILYSKDKTQVLDVAPTHTFENDTCLLPDSVVSFKTAIYARNISSFSVSAENTRFSVKDGVLLDKTGKTLVAYPNGRNNISYEVPDTVQVIGERAFYGSALQRVVLPESVQYIEAYAFAASALTDAVLPSSLLSIKDGAFYDTKLVYLDLPAGSVTLGEESLYSSSLKKIHVPAGAATDFTDALHNATKLVYGDENSYDTADASGTCGENLTWELKNGVLIISGSGPMECQSYLKYPWYEKSFYRVVFSGENITITDGAFQNAFGLNVLELSGVVSIGKEAFANCTGLARITEDASVTYAGNDAFKDTPWRKTAGLHYREDDASGLAAVGGVVVYCVGDAESVSIPDRMTLVMDYAFSDCTALHTLYVPKDGVYYTDHVFTGNQTIEHVRWNGSENDITIEELRAAGAECETVTLTDVSGNTVTGKGIRKEDSILLLANAMYETPFMQQMRDDYCRTVIAETGCNSDMTDEALLRAFYDYLTADTSYGFTYMESAEGVYAGHDSVWSMCSYHSHAAGGLLTLQTGVCSSYEEMFEAYASVLSEDSITDTIAATENRGEGHEWNVIGLDVGTAEEKWYYLDASNGLYLFGYESDVLKTFPAMFSYDASVPENADGTYTITLTDGMVIDLEGSFAEGSLQQQGDVNRDNAVNIADASLVLAIYAQQAAGLVPDAGAEEIAASDVDGDGDTDLTDASAILCYYAQSAAGLSPDWDEILK